MYKRQIKDSLYGHINDKVHNYVCGRLEHILINLETNEHTELQKIIIDNIKRQVNEHMKEGITFNIKSIYSNK